MKNTRNEALACVSRERDYQEKKWPNKPMGPSDALRVICARIAQADPRWRETADRLVDGVRINDVDLHALRKIAATAVQALERWGVTDRPLSELAQVFSTEEIEEIYRAPLEVLTKEIQAVKAIHENLLADNPTLLDDPEGPDGRVNTGAYAIPRARVNQSFKLARELVHRLSSVIPNARESLGAGLPELSKAGIDQAIGETQDFMEHYASLRLSGPVPGR